MQHPLSRVHSHIPLEGSTECVVVAEATLESQLLGGCWLVCCCRLMVYIDKVLYAQVVDVGIVSDALRGKVLAEVGAVDAD